MYPLRLMAGCDEDRNCLNFLVSFSLRDLGLLSAYWYRLSTPISSVDNGNEFSLLLVLSYSREVGIIISGSSSGEAVRCHWVSDEKTISWWKNPGQEDRVGDNMHRFA